ncbi:type II toxin-antitoxin system VapB family antitoxin [Paraburkholderia sp. MMS20-SJTR3]|uniref:Type II toxin-antitoxin system VapB family antitoxin n=1 Tax=Paraburkholderia sejongensis TaxID=2886946 RepID=A0ABS8K3R1_9BURK|nr:type II toxin-antitoxin system VapB family antitoxin [Paraburkholderia sp. MMS20-SJTR3]MCC8396800.1 type II toxin-antitoxin system VapB family antitoxin [Paraburkholderia sp. MMS20-SJTR3]
MRTVSIFKNGTSQAVRIPKEMRFEGVTELEIRREGDTIMLRPARPSWTSFADEPRADADFMSDRPAIFQTGRCSRCSNTDNAEESAP